VKWTLNAPVITPEAVQSFMRSIAKLAVKGFETRILEIYSQTELPRCNEEPPAWTNPHRLHQ